MKQLFFLILGCIAHSTAFANFITVGSGLCDETNLDDALEKDVDEIRLVNQNGFAVNQTINKSVTIIGGFATCEDATNEVYDMDHNNNVVKSKIIKGQNLNVLNINGGEDEIEVFLRYIKFSGGNNFNLNEGPGGIDIKGENTVVRMFDNSVVNNSGSQGGGIRIKDSSLFLTRTIISSNTASQSGGGIYCSGSGALVSISNSAISLNTSEYGGGLFISDGCAVTNYASKRYNQFSEKKGIFNNIASQQGGGVFIENIASSFHNRNSYPGLSIYGNSAESGGGLAATDSSLIFFEDTVVDGNTAQTNGGGLIIANGARLITSNSYSVSIQNNHASSSFGALSVYGEESSAELNNVKIINNTSTQSAVLGVSFGAQVTMTSEGDGCVLYDPCMLISNNISSASDLILVRNAHLEINKTLISNNTLDGISGLRGLFKLYSSIVRIKSSLIADNDASNILAVKESDDLQPSNIDINHTTIVNNTLNQLVFNDATQIDSYLNITNSILHGLLLSNTDDDGNTYFLCNLVDTEIDLYDDENVMFEYNRIDAGNNFIGGNNFRLIETSEAIDMCAESNGVLNDLDGILRGEDYPLVDNLEGTFDAGAYEFNPNDRSDIIFKDGF